MFSVRHLFGGNQLAVLTDATGISTEGIQKIAPEFNFGDDL
jgi:predicted PhzF superfamily epimerase YddE/YHI9